MHLTCSKVAALMLALSVAVPAIDAIGDEPVWSATAALNTNAGTDTGEDYWPHVATDGMGTWVAVWFSLDSLGNTIGTDADILFSRSTDDGATWTAPAALNTNASSDTGEDSSVRVSADGQGTWVAVWESSDYLGNTIGWDYDILVSRSTDGGLSWSAPAALNTNAGTDAGSDLTPQVCTDSEGTWVTVWASYDSLGGTVGEDQDILVSRSTDGGLLWSAPAALNMNAGTDTGNDQAPQVRTDSEGTWVTVWYSDDSLGEAIGEDLDILASHSTDGGLSWSTPAPLNSNAAADTGADLHPVISTDRDGTWVAVWQSTDALGGIVGTDADILVSRSTDGGTTWTASAALNSNASTDSAIDRYPSVTTDGLGNWIAVWESWDSLGGTIGGDADILVSRSTDGGSTWTPASALNAYAATDAGHDYDPEIAADGQGNWAVVWFSSDSLGASIGPDLDILFSTTFIELPGSLRVKIAPAPARSAGAQWRVELEPGVWSDWKNHGETVTGLEAGQHTVEFKGLTGWDGPAATTVSIVAGALRKRTDTYCQHGALVVTLKPKGARDAGARWRVSTGPSTWTKWKKSATMVSGLSSGVHIVQCSSVPGFTTPGNRKLTVSPTSGSTVNRKYK
ncbi:MAG: exo-alpha-sialidase [Candidatus Hydrogenedentes bacterium]|nr:exo-alpha-sialidase [Candidatus Hydrogenedentota bacterium]